MTRPQVPGRHFTIVLYNEKKAQQAGAGYPPQGVGSLTPDVGNKR